MPEDVVEEAKTDGIIELFDLDLIKLKYPSTETRSSKYEMQYILEKLPHHIPNSYIRTITLDGVKKNILYFSTSLTGEFRWRNPEHWKVDYARVTDEFKSFIKWVSENAYIDTWPVWD